MKYLMQFGIIIGLSLVGEVLNSANTVTSTGKRLGNGSSVCTSLSKGYKAGSGTGRRRLSFKVL